MIVVIGVTVGVGVGKGDSVTVGVGVGVGEVRGRGAMQAIELVIPGGIEPNPAALGAIIKFCQNEGVLILSAFPLQNLDETIDVYTLAHRDCSASNVRRTCQTKGN